MPTLLASTLQGFGLGVVIGLPLALSLIGLSNAKVWIVERWGGRAAAYLVLKARNLRRKHVAFRLQRVALSRKRGDCLPVLVVLPGSPGNASNANNGRNNAKERLH